MHLSGDNHKGMCAAVFVCACMQASVWSRVLWLTELDEGCDPESAPSADVTLHKRTKSLYVSRPLLLFIHLVLHPLSYLITLHPLTSKLACQKWGKKRHQPKLLENPALFSFLLFPLLSWGRISSFISDLAHMVHQCSQKHAEIQMRIWQGPASEQ